ncbi:uncharacterized protein LOC107370411 [Tetranychus urticae]|uniref:uncharacterized protein LOC107370411 n=1 Tax=Tetranychus urticae TaxID=32264 RepID=UPI00077BCA91|nr:uncharacterized protein LOC107370411 [Tetranychus urticae]
MYRTTPNTTVLSLTDSSPIDRVLRSIKIKYEILSNRPDPNNVNNIIPGDRPLEDKIGKGFSDNALPCSQIKGQKYFNEPLDLQPSNEEVWQIYTDGSKTPDGVGFGFCVINSRGEILKKGNGPLFGYATIYQAECYAVKTALNFLGSKLDKAPRVIHILTDSESLFSALHTYSMQHELIEDIRVQAAEIMRRGYKIIFNWVKAHVGIRGNEYADELAKKGVRSKKSIEYDKVPRSFVKNHLKHYLKSETKLAWIQNKSKSFLEDIHLNPGWLQDTSESPGKELLWLISGHGPFPNYLSRMRIIRSCVCYCGHADPGVVHLMDDCDVLEKTRRHILQRFSSANRPSYKLSSLFTLNFSTNISVLNGIAKIFVRQLKLLNSAHFNV